MYLLLLRRCLHSPVLKPILGLSLAGRTQAVGVAVFSLALSKMGSFPMFFTSVITDRWMADPSYMEKAGGSHEGFK